MERLQKSGSHAPTIVACLFLAIGLVVFAGSVFGGYANREESRADYKIVAMIRDVDYRKSVGMMSDWKNPVAGTGYGASAAQVGRAEAASYSPSAHGKVSMPDIAPRGAETRQQPVEIPFNAGGNGYGTRGKE